MAASAACSSPTSAAPGSNSQPFKICDSNAQRDHPALTAPNGQIIRPAQRIDGFRLVDTRASYGIGLETFALGFPVHFDWSYRTMFNKPWEDLVYAGTAGRQRRIPQAALRRVDRVRLLASWKLETRN